MHLQYIVPLGLLCLFLFCGATSNAQSAEEVAPRFVDISPNSLIYIQDTYYYIESSAPKNWFNALAACKGIGYQLVSLQTSEKFNQVVNFLISSGQSLYFWTSGNDIYTPGTHHWYPGNEPILAGLWAPRQPDNVGGVEHCDALWKTSNNYTLKDNNCNLLKNYICEVPAPTATTEPSTSTSLSTSTSNAESSSSLNP